MWTHQYTEKYATKSTSNGAIFLVRTYSKNFADFILHISCGKSVAGPPLMNVPLDFKMELERTVCMSLFSGAVMLLP